MARVLIVDDEDEIRFLYKQLLSEAGHLVFVASDAEEARAILLQEDIDVGLIDRILPGEESGLDILKFIQAERPLCKTILISGYPTFHSASEALRHNAFDYLTKPVGRIKLCETIESAFKQKQLHKQEMLAAEESKKNYEVLRSKQELLQHDMRSMLIGIAGFVNLLINRTVLDDTQLEYCKQIQHCSIQLENMINTYLDISRLERPCVEMARIEFDFLDIVRQSRKTLHFLADEKNVDISLIYNRKMLSLNDIVLFEGDRTYLQSTIDNLVKNAIEASPPNQRVKVIVKDDEDLLYVRIHNWGAVPNELINTFFEKYSTSGKKKGIGLGTYLARLVINAHHGEIGVISTEDEGTTITIKLPLPLDKTETRGRCAMHQIGVSAPS